MARFFFLFLSLALLGTASKPPSKAKPAPAALKGPSQAQRWMQTMTLRDKAAQLLMVHFYGEVMNPRSRAYRQFVPLVRDLHVGGLIMLNRVRNGTARKAEPLAMAAFLNRMQKQSALPLLVGGDFERGASMRLKSTAQFPHAMAFGATRDTNATRALGRATAREGRAIGVHWVFGPSADVNNNPDNPIINIRSFSENPNDVAAHVKAFIEGAHSDAAHPVLVTAKHFPGHGDTATDSHIGLASVTAARERMNAVELVPFRAAIEAGVDAVMTAHLAVPAYETEEIPATVSKAILTGLLRDEMQFQGIVVTDAMDMQGLSKAYPAGEAAVRAIEAGADVLLVPPDPAAAVNALVEAVRSGRLTEKRLDRSVLKVLNAKARLGLNKNRLVNLDKIDERVDTPEDQELAASVAGNAMTALRNRDGVLPLKPDTGACYFALSPTRSSTLGRDFLGEVQKRAPAAYTAMLDPQMPEFDLGQIVEKSKDCSRVVLATYVTAAAYRGEVGLPGAYPGFVRSLLGNSAPVIIVSFGSPYLLRSFPDVAGYLAAYSTSSPSEAAGVMALFGETPVHGRLPVTIPDVAGFGAGLDIPPLAALAR